MPSYPPPSSSNEVRSESPPAIDAGSISNLYQHQSSLDPIQQSPWNPVGWRGGLTGPSSFSNEVPPRKVVATSWSVNWADAGGNLVSGHFQNYHQDIYFSSPPWFRGGGGGVRAEPVAAAAATAATNVYRELSVTVPEFGAPEAMQSLYYPNYQDHLSRSTLEPVAPYPALMPPQHSSDQTSPNNSGTNWQGERSTELHLKDDSRF